MIGHIKIDRKILNWEWYNDYKMVHLFLHLLIKANWTDATWRGIKIKRGQHITSVATLSANTGLSTAQIRNCLFKLQTTGEITSETTNKNTIITVCKYDTYQSEKSKDSKQNNKQTSEQTDKPVSKPTDNNIRKQEDKKTINSFYKPTAADFNGLPEIKNGSVVQLFKITKQTDISATDVSGLWEIFKIQNLTGKKIYTDEDDVYGHFINWSKTQNIQKNGTGTNSGSTKLSPSAGREEARRKY